MRKTPGGHIQHPIPHSSRAHDDFPHCDLRRRAANGRSTGRGEGGEDGQVVVVLAKVGVGVLGYINVTNSQCSFIWVCPANLSMKSCQSVCQLEVRASEQIRDENTVSS